MFPLLSLGRILYMTLTGYQNQCSRKTFMVHQTFVRWALIYILFKFVKSLIRHLGLAIGNVRRVRWISWTLQNSSPSNDWWVTRPIKKRLIWNMVNSGAADAMGTWYIEYNLPCTRVYIWGFAAIEPHTILCTSMHVWVNNICTDIGKSTGPRSSTGENSGGPMKTLVVPVLLSS